MSTKLKLGGLGAAAASAIDPHVPGLYASPGKTVLAVVEMEHTERTQPGPRSDKDASVTVKIIHAEVPSIEQERDVREVMRYLYLQRTVRGTIDEADVAVMDESTLRLAAGRLEQSDALACRIALRYYAEMARRARYNEKGTEATLRADLQAISDGIDAYLGDGQLGIKG